MLEQFPEKIEKTYRDKPEKFDNATLTELATSPKENEHNQQLAMDEIAKREKAGTYILDEAVSGTSIDTEKDEDQPIDTRERNLKQGAIINDIVSREKLHRPFRAKKEREAEAFEREYSKRERDLEREKRRLFKNENRYNANYIDLDKQKAAEEKADLPFYEDDDKVRSEVRMDTEENFDRVLNRAGERLSRHLDEYYIEGALDDLAHGKLSINPRGFVADGFRRIEGSDIEQNLVDEQKESFWHDIKTDVVPEHIGEWGSDIDNIKNAEKQALLKALKLGAFLEQTSLDKPKEVRLALPIIEHGNGGLQNFMREYGVDPESQYVQMDSHEGFIGIVEAIKNNDEISKGFRALDWYFDTFRYQEHFEEFFDSMDAYQAQSDRPFRQKLKEYLDYRKEIEEWEKQQAKQEEVDLSALADAEEVTQDVLFDFLRDNMQSESGEEIFNHEDSNQTREKYKNRKKASWPSSEEKCEKALEEIKEIIKIDPDATYYKGTVFRNDSYGTPKEHPYAIIRFGNMDLGLNNVIAIPIGDESRAMFYWRGETGDDPDGWKKYFKDTSIRNRDTSVKRCRCHGYSQKGYLALDAQWERVWRYLNSPKKSANKLVS